MDRWWGSKRQSLLLNARRNTATHRAPTNLRLRNSPHRSQTSSQTIDTHANHSHANVSIEAQLQLTPKWSAAVRQYVPHPVCPP